MQGRRRDVDICLMQPGDYGRWNGGWYAYPPWKHGLANISAHKITEHEDGTITVEPSILVKTGNGHEWHGFLKHGVFES